MTSGVKGGTHIPLMRISVPGFPVTLPNIREGWRAVGDSRQSGVLECHVLSSGRIFTGERTSQQLTGAPRSRRPPTVCLMESPSCNEVKVWHALLSDTWCISARFFASNGRSTLIYVRSKTEFLVCMMDSRVFKSNTACYECSASHVRSLRFILKINARSLIVLSRRDGHFSLRRETNSVAPD
jgi:hypothetical protein